MDGVVRLDNWINLDMDPHVASQILSLRPALESLVIRASKEPEQVLEMSPLDVEVSMVFNVSFLIFNLIADSNLMRSLTYINSILPYK